MIAKRFFYLFEMKDLIQRTEQIIITGDVISVSDLLWWSLQLKDKYNLFVMLNIDTQINTVWLDEIIYTSHMILFGELINC